MTPGAYGLRLAGAPPGLLDDVLLCDTPASWRELAFNWVEVDDPGDAPKRDELRDHLGDDDATIDFESGDTLTVNRDPLHARLTTRARIPDALAHPQLAWLSAIVARWDHRPLIHGGVVIIGERAWALVADKGQGKSTSLAFLHANGASVMADDQVVVIGANVMCGPRVLDLRPAAPEDLRALGRRVVRLEERWRVNLPASPPEVPFAGIVMLAAAHGDNASGEQLTPIRPSERLPRLAPHLVLPGDAAMPDLLPLVAFPMFEWSRPLRPEYLARLPEVLADLEARA